MEYQSETRKDKKDKGTNHKIKKKNKISNRQQLILWNYHEFSQSLPNQYFVKRCLPDQELYLYEDWGISAAEEGQTQHSWSNAQ